MGVYPFMFSAVKDFEPIVEKLVEVGFNSSDLSGAKWLKLSQGDYKEPYDWDDYAQVYFPKAEELVAEAEKAEKEGNKEKASEFYL